jgi:hypothetical protein
MRNLALSLSLMSANGDRISTKPDVFLFCAATAAVPWEAMKTVYSKSAAATTRTRQDPDANAQSCSLWRTSVQTRRALEILYRWPALGGVAKSARAAGIGSLTAWGIDRVQAAAPHRPFCAADITTLDSSWAAPYMAHGNGAAWMPSAFWHKREGTALFDMLPSAVQLSSFVTLVIPGIVILGIRTRVTRGSLPPLKDQIAAYAVVAVCYLAIAAPLFHSSFGPELPAWLWNLLLNIGLPAFIGLVLAYAHQWGISYAAASFFRLRLFHHVPTAWDYAFENVASGSHVLVHLKDGLQIPGQLGTGSFVSSSAAERDILLSSVWEIDSMGAWTEAVPARSLLICAGDIRWIEIF